MMVKTINNSEHFLLKIMAHSYTFGLSYRVESLERLFIFGEFLTLYSIKWPFNGGTYWNFITSTKT